MGAVPLNRRLRKTRSTGMMSSASARRKTAPFWPARGGGAPDNKIRRSWGETGGRGREEAMETEKETEKRDRDRDKRQRQRQRQRQRDRDRDRDREETETETEGEI